MRPRSVFRGNTLFFACPKRLPGSFPRLGGWARGAFAFAALAVSCPGRGTAAELKGTLAADRSRIAVGESIRLALTVRGEGNPDDYAISFPALPRLRHLTPAGMALRNEVVYRSAGNEFSRVVLYTLRAAAAGEERIPSFRMTYRKVGEEGEKPLQVEGMRIEVCARAHPAVRTVVAAVCAAGGLILLAAAAARSKRRAASRPRAFAARPGPGPAVTALSRIEDARRAKIAGDWGSYGAAVASALSAYLASAPAAEIESLVSELRGLCDRVRYAGDEGAERDVERISRAAELFLKNIIRDDARRGTGSGA